MDYITYLEQAEFWHWWAIALVLMIVEVTFFGAFVLIWIGVAAAAVGVALLLMPELSWQGQFFIWGALSAGLLLAWFKYRKNNPSCSDEPHLNKRGRQYIGQTFTLEEAVENGRGKINVDDTVWNVSSPEDFKKGTKVKVTALEGTTLSVEKA